MQNPILICISGIYHVHTFLLHFLTFSSASSSLESLLYKFPICFTLHSLRNLSLCHLTYSFLNNLITFIFKVCIPSFKGSSNFEEDKTRLFLIITIPLFHCLFWGRLLRHIKYSSISILFYNQILCQSCFLIQEARQAALWLKMVQQGNILWATVVG